MRWTVCFFGSGSEMACPNENVRDKMGEKGLWEGCTFFNLEEILGFCPGLSVLDDRAASGRVLNDEESYALCFFSEILRIVTASVATLYGTLTALLQMSFEH